MTARDELLNYLKARSWDSGCDGSEDMTYCEEIVHAYAHELADKIRTELAWCDAPNGTGSCCGAHEAADLIDPEVNK